jgi:hypothetical protein
MSEDAICSPAPHLREVLFVDGAVSVVAAPDVVAAAEAACAETGRPLGDVAAVSSSFRPMTEAEMAASRRLRLIALVGTAVSSFALVVYVLAKANGLLRGL